MLAFQVTLTGIARAAGWACIVLLAMLSLLPADEMVRTTLGGQLEHASAYAGTAVLLELAYRRPVRIAVALLSYAAILELLQHFSPGRHPAVADWIASSVGALAGVVIVSIAAAFYPRWNGIP
jgi:VanZ family protein